MRGALCVAVVATLTGCSLLPVETAPPVMRNDATKASTTAATKAVSSDVEKTTAAPLKSPSPAVVSSTIAPAMKDLDPFDGPSLCTLMAEFNDPGLYLNALVKPPTMLSETDMGLCQLLNEEGEYAWLSVEFASGPQMTPERITEQMQDAKACLQGLDTRTGAAQGLEFMDFMCSDSDSFSSNGTSVARYVIVGDYEFFFSVSLSTENMIMSFQDFDRIATPLMTAARDRL